MAIDISSTSELRAAPITRLQGDAWAAWNASYHAPEQDAYRVVSMALYRQDVHERVQALFARSDAQNALLDRVLAERTRSES